MPATVAPLSYAGLDYLRAFDLACVAVSPSGRVFVCRNQNPHGAAAAWWCRSDDADQIANAAWMNADVPGAAHRLGLTVTPHETVRRRVGERTAALDDAIEKAIDAGTLKAFNAEYRQRRLQAKKNGQRFMSYSEAHTRLRRVVTEMVAKGGLVTGSLIAGVFDAK